MATVLDALRNSKFNFESLRLMGLNENPFFEMALSQLSNAIKALDNDKSPHDTIQESVVNNVDTGKEK